MEYRLKKLHEQILILKNQLEEYSLKSRNNQNKASSLHKIEALLQRETAFAAFKRCYIRENLDKYPEFEEYVK